MSDVELISKKSFSDIDSEIIDRFMEFQQALIDKDEVRLNEILTLLCKNSPASLSRR